MALRGIEPLATPSQQEQIDEYIDTREPIIVENAELKARVVELGENR